MIDALRQVESQDLIHDVLFIAHEQRHHDPHAGSLAMVDTGVKSRRGVRCEASTGW
jgi:hypothetical protein